MSIELLPQQLSDDLLSADELVDLANAEGMNISKRTLRYWAAEGLIPRPMRVSGEGIRSFHPRGTIERLRVLSATMPNRIRELRENVSEAETLQFGDRTFRVLPASVKWEGENTEFSVQMLEDGSGMLLVKRKKKT